MLLLLLYLNDDSDGWSDWLFSVSTSDWFDDVVWLFDLSDESWGDASIVVCWCDDSVRSSSEEVVFVAFLSSLVLDEDESLSTCSYLEISSSKWNKDEIKLVKLKPFSKWLGSKKFDENEWFESFMLNTDKGVWYVSSSLVLDERLFFECVDDGLEWEEASSFETVSDWLSFDWESGFLLSELSEVESSEDGVSLLSVRVVSDVEVESSLFDSDVLVSFVFSSAWATLDVNVGKTRVVVSKYIINFCFDINKRSLILYNIFYKSVLSQTISIVF